MDAEPRPLSFRKVTKSFGTVRALKPVSLQVDSGEFVTLLGPSGSGKTTLLNIAAILHPNSGAMFIGDINITSSPARKRNMGMVFQNYALFPHMTVAENVAYGLTVRRLPKGDREARRRGAAHDAPRRLRRALDPRAFRRPAAAGRPRSRNGDPTGYPVDGRAARRARPPAAQGSAARIRRLHAARPRTTIYVTHDQEEALVMSDRIAVMRAGRIVQIGTGVELYERSVDTSSRASWANPICSGNRGRERRWTRHARRARLRTPLEGRAGDGLRAGEAARRCSARRRSGAGRRIASARHRRVYLGELVAVRLVLASGHELWSRRLAGEWSGRDTVEIGWDSSAISILPNASFDHKSSTMRRKSC